MGDFLDERFADSPDFLTPDDVAEFLVMSKAGVYRWLKDGTLPAYRLGKVWRIPLVDFKEWLRASSNTAPSRSQD